MGSRESLQPFAPGDLDHLIVIHCEVFLEFLNIGGKHGESESTHDAATYVNDSTVMIVASDSGHFFSYHLQEL